MKYYLFLGYLFLPLLLPAQTIEVREVLPLEGPYRIVNLQFDGLSKESTSLNFSFSHFGAGVQSENGPLKMGGKEPQTVYATGSIPIDETGAPTGGTTLQWYSPPSASEKVNIYANPIDILTMADNTLLAKRGEVKGYGALAEFGLGIQEKAAWFTLADDTISKKETTHVDEYKTTYVNLGLGGGIQALTSATYTLKPEEKWSTGAIEVSDYKMKASFLKGPAKKFFKDKDYSFKVISGYSGSLAQAADPRTANMVVFNAIKYKKRPDKKNSHFTEFLTLAIDAAGNVTSSDIYESDEPLQVAQFFHLGGERLSQHLRLTNKVAIILRGGGKANMEDVDGTLRRALVIDINTGKIISQSDINLPEGSNTTIATDILPSGDVEMLNYNAATGQIQTIRLTEKGLELSEPLFRENSELLAGINPEKLELFSLGNTVSSTGQMVRFHALARVDREQYSLVTEETIYGYLAELVGADGRPERFVSLAKGDRLRTFAREGDVVLLSTSLTTQAVGEDGRKKITNQFLFLDLAAGTVRRVAAPIDVLPQNEYMLYDQGRKVLFGLLFPTEELGPRLMSLSY
ncbi:hypothetical protein [Neolewinella antarctica]|uniref:Uncharacterized protein n=1 Tax=Neolewinella antarctica TaxID=442734 RepID=A0ABX0XEN5_9BACT|nr:hypothetical protein [Neolewinella antarctica]NJC27343.1 hypothetical protein [Neolewinella antarctica]